MLSLTSQSCVQRAMFYSKTCVEDQSGHDLQLAGSESCADSGMWLYCSVSSGGTWCVLISQRGQ